MIILIKKFFAYFSTSALQSNIAVTMEDEVWPLFMFPPVNWWRQVAQQEQVSLSAAAFFQKGSLYNRYRIVAANGPMWLTVPLEGGRLQKIPVRDLRISYSDRWQHRHRQTLISAYGRAPFFEALWFLIEPLFEKQFLWLQDFNLAGINAVSRALRQNTSWKTSEAQPHFNAWAQPDESPVYRQVFASRHGFQSNVSILDLLFCHNRLMA